MSEKQHPILVDATTTQTRAFCLKLHTEAFTLPSGVSALPHEIEMSFELSPEQYLDALVKICEIAGVSLNFGAPEEKAK